MAEYTFLADTWISKENGYGGVAPASLRNEISFVRPAVHKFFASSSVHGIPYSVMIRR